MDTNRGGALEPEGEFSQAEVTSIEGMNSKEEIASGRYINSLLDFTNESLQNIPVKAAGVDVLCGQPNDTVPYHQESLEDKYETASNYSSDVPLLEPSRAPEEPFDVRIDAAVDNKTIHSSTLDEYSKSAVDDRIYEALQDPLPIPQKSSEEICETASNYSSDVPLLEPTRAPEEPFNEKIDATPDEGIHACTDNELETRAFPTQTVCEGAYINPSADVGAISTDFTSIPLEAEQQCQSDLTPVTPRSPKKLHIMVTLDEYNTLDNQSFNVDDIDVVDVQEVTATPIHVIGACWEFGSMSSIHIHSNRDSLAFRSRTNTLDQQSYLGSKTDMFRGSNRLLARVFSNTIGSIELTKKDTKEVSMTFLPDGEPEIDYTFQEETSFTNRNTRNLLVASAGVSLLFVAMFGLTNLQSSMNSEGGLGVYSLAMSFLAYMLGSLISTVTVKRYRPKVCLVMGCLSPLFYVLAHFHPTFAFFLPASFILGLSKAILWNAVQTYITEIGFNESKAKGKEPDSVISRYFGIFFLLLQMSFVFGNLFSSLILVPRPNPNLDVNLTLNQSNVTGMMNVIYSDNVTEKIAEYSLRDKSASTVCGSGYCNADGAEGSATEIDDIQKTILLGVYSVCVILSTIIMVLFLDHLPDYKVTYINLRDVAYQAKSLFTMLFDRRFLLILVLCMYTVLSNGFIVADILKAFVTCPLGIHMVGYTMICFGLTGAASSYIAGKLIKHTGRIAVYITATAFNVGSLLWMIIWQPKSEDTIEVFVLLGLWGIGEGIWQSQINSLISSLFADRYEDAFGACRIVQGVAGMIVYTLSENLCMMLKIVIIMTSCIVGVVMYIVMEMMRKMCPHKK